MRQITIEAGGPSHAIFDAIVAKHAFGQIDYSSLIRAAQTFAEALDEARTPQASTVVRDGAIQRFEYCFELAWKTMKRILRSKGSEVNHARDVIREAAQEGWIDEPVLWFNFLEQRNQSSHIYNQDIAAEVYRHLPSFQLELGKLLEKLSRGR